MFGKYSLIVGPALAASLAIPQGFAAEALAAPLRVDPEVAAPAEPQDPCETRGHGCQPGITQGQLDGHRCIAPNPQGHGDSGLPDFEYGYYIGYEQGWNHEGCDERGQWTDDNGNGEDNGNGNGEDNGNGNGNGEDNGNGNGNGEGW
ncbi:hypothetical protein [Streptosporangium sp. NPDC003464]